MPSAMDLPTVCYGCGACGGIFQIEITMLCLKMFFNVFLYPVSARNCPKAVSRFLGYRRFAVWQNRQKDL